MIEGQPIPDKSSQYQDRWLHLKDEGGVIEQIRRDLPRFGAGFSSESKPQTEEAAMAETVLRIRNMMLPYSRALIEVKTISEQSSDLSLRRGHWHLSGGYDYLDLILNSLDSKRLTLVHVSSPERNLVKAALSGATTAAFMGWSLYDIGANQKGFPTTEFTLAGLSYLTWVGFTMFPPSRDWLFRPHVLDTIFCEEIKKASTDTLSRFPFSSFESLGNSWSVYNLYNFPYDSSYAAELKFNVPQNRFTDIFYYQPDQGIATRYSFRQKGAREWFEVAEFQNDPTKSENPMIFKPTAQYKYALCGDRYFRRQPVNPTTPTIEQELVHILDRLPFKKASLKI